MVTIDTWGETALFYNPEQKLKRGVYFLTLKQKDGKNDTASKLNRPDAYRLNLGISKESFIDLFGRVPARPAAGKTVKMRQDFSVLDEILPHPVYAWMAWICLLSPSQETFEKLLPLIDESYELAQQKYQLKVK